MEYTSPAVLKAGPSVAHIGLPWSAPSPLGGGVSLKGEPLPVPQVTVWHLTSGFAKATRGADPREVIRRIHSGIDQPYPLLARLRDDICVYENLQARSLAHFVREVRPAHDDLEAAEKITAPGPAVRDLA